MTHHTYPTSAMLGDYLRAAAGFVPAAAILATTSLGTAGLTIVGGFAALFGIFGVSTALRHQARIELTETGLFASGPFGRRILWSELERMKLTYYSTHRDRRAGWMQLELRAPGAKLRIDSRIEDFPTVVERAATAAAARGLPLNETTVANLDSLGVAPDEPELRYREPVGGTG